MMGVHEELLKTAPSRAGARLSLWYWVLAGARVLLTLVPQTGYLHPDEFFQNVEVVAGEYCPGTKYVAPFESHAPVFLRRCIADNCIDLFSGNCK